MIEVIQSSLAWAPGGIDPIGKYKLVDSAECKVGHLFRIQDQTDINFRAGEYSVPHYGRMTTGRAFGPLALDQTLRFCQVLESKLKEHGRVTFASTRNSVADRANSAVLLGAFLILRREWSVDQCIKDMSEDADLGFPCSWSFAEGPAAQEPNTLVRDCWAAVKLAFDMGWINEHSCHDELTVSLACSQYVRMAHEYDATWIEPGRLIVSADPMSTVNDPNPETCDQLLPGAQVSAKDYSQIWTASTNASGNPESDSDGATAVSVMTPNHSHLSLCTLGEDADNKSDTSKTTQDWPVDQKARDDDKISNGSRSTHRAVNYAVPQGTKQPSEQPSSCHTVCKSYRPPQGNTAGGNGLAGTRNKPLDFASWLLSQHVGLMIRANRSDERGLIEHGGSYDPLEMEKIGIQHCDLPVLDKHGGVPDRNVIQCAIERASEVGESGTTGHKAMLVHCKGGFGRSVVLACCVMMYWHDLPGRSLLGWSRIVRPGSITTVDQERFLCRLKGREDLKRFLSRNGKGCCEVM